MADEDNEPQYITLVSSDKFEFIVDRECAMVSGTMKAMLSGPGEYAETLNNKIEFPDIPASLLEIICQYCYYKVRYANSQRQPPPFAIKPEIALDILMAANFLDV
eukprot:TRINITY_DN21645_c0_g1_i1.p1 TRINITY_DN21645_c0_g1~~TRINITY_DN21645_c0_g1_i1.p1  ORF type:complete len:105 (+),score=17.07 TRINITY_DN21645_c0_g1_i1:331-645(+)